MENKIKIIMSILFIVSFICGGFLGSGIKESNISKDFQESINYCEDDGQILRAYSSSYNDINVECFGELSDTAEIHIRFE